MNELTPYIKRSYVIVRCAVTGCDQLGFRDDGCPNCGEFRCKTHANTQTPMNERYHEGSWLIDPQTGIETCWPCFNNIKPQLAIGGEEGVPPPDFEKDLNELKSELLTTEVRRRYWHLYMQRFKSMVEGLDGVQESPLEQALWAEMFVRKLDAYYTPQIQLFTEAGEYIVRADFVSLLLKIAIFTDGRTYHSSPEAIAKDKKHNSLLRAMGWIVVRYWTEEIKDHSAEKAEEIYQITCNRIKELCGYIEPIV